MKEDFVAYKLAVKLKEKGFPQRPDYFNYSSYYDWDGLRKIHSLSNASVWFDPNISRDNLYFAPTISQVLKWLREEKCIDVIIRPIFVNGKREYTTEIYAPRYNKPYYIGNIREWKKSAIIGIEYILENLI